MQERFLGRSGLRVSALGLGTMTWGSVVEAEQCATLLDDFLAAGGTLVDTAASYGAGASESVLGDLLRTDFSRDDLVLASKAGARSDTTKGPDCSRRSLMAELDASLQRLGTSHLDIWMVETWDRDVPSQEVLSTLEDAVTTGKARYTAVSNYPGWQLAKVAALAKRPIIAAQTEYSLINRSAEAEIFPAAKDAGAGVIAWAPLGRGVLTGKYRGRIPRDSRAASEEWADYVEPYLSGAAKHIVEAVATAAEGLGRKASDIALSWLLDRPGVASAVIGPRTPEQLQTLLESALEPLPEQITDVLDEVSTIVRR